MTTTTVFPGPPGPPGPAANGGTALGARPDRPRHVVGDVLHALRVFAVTAVEVVILGTGTDPKRAEPLGAAAPADR